MVVRVFIVVAVVLFAAATGHAAPSDGEAVAAFEEGKELFHAKKYAEAAEAFREANRLRSSWKLQYNIGQAEAAGKRYGLALESFEVYLAEGGDEIDSDRQKEVRQEIDRLSDMVGFVSVEAPEGTTVTVDGILRGTAPLTGAIRVSSGIEHALMIRDDSQILFERNIRIGSKETIDLRFEPEAEGSPAPVMPTPEPVDEKGGSKLKPAGWAVVGVGAATLIAGLAVGGGAMAKRGDLESNCEDTTCSPDQAKTLQSARDLAGAASILIPVGAGITAVGVVMVLVGTKKKESNVAVVPSPFGLAIKGRF